MIFINQVSLNNSTLNFIKKGECRELTTTAESKKSSITRKKRRDQNKAQDEVRLPGRKRVRPARWKKFRFAHLLTKSREEGEKKKR